MRISEKLRWTEEVSIRLTKLDNCKLCSINKFMEGIICIKNLQKNNDK